MVWQPTDNRYYWKPLAEALGQDGTFEFDHQPPGLDPGLCVRLEGGRPVKGTLLVSRVSAGQRVDWVHVKPAPQHGDRQYSVHAARAFRAGDAVGVYVGRVVARADEEAAKFLADLPNEHPHNAVLTLGCVLIDGKQPHDPWGAHIAGRVKPKTMSERHPSTNKQLVVNAPSWAKYADQAERVPWPGMFAHLMNEARRGVTHNVCVTEPDGVVVAACDIPVGTELLWKYALV